MNAEDGTPVTVSSAKGQRLALILFCGGLASLFFFNILPGFGSEERGWTIWVEIIRFVQSPELFRDTKDLISIASLLSLLVLVTASPFLIPVYLKSRLAWWLATLMAGIITSALWFILLFMVAPPRLGVGGWCLLAAPALNLAGLLALRFAKRPD
ncbi:MAG: hypothetical protein B9S38_12355 [Verrucomicrobiia bacterium Tous-C4TDCM]|nr:MAG: hypothetical protein B9S38_12355 [Verrucomicrobiae bacterium Tous-C4TDCM]